MAPASPSALLAVPDRSGADRPEPKGPDAAEGQFAGLMAHFVQTPVTVGPPAPPAKDPAPAVAEGPAEPPATPAPATAEAPGGRTRPEPAKAEASAAAAPVRDGGEPQAVPAVQDGAGPADARPAGSAAAGVAVAGLPQPPVPTDLARPDSAAPAPSGLPAIPAAPAAPAAPTVTLAASQMPPAAAQPSPRPPRPQAEALPAATRPPAPELPAVPRGATISITPAPAAPLPEGPAPVPPGLPQAASPSPVPKAAAAAAPALPPVPAPAPGNPSQPPVPVVTQAALAESTPPARRAVPAEGRIQTQIPEAPGGLAADKPVVLTEAPPTLALPARVAPTRELPLVQPVPSGPAAPPKAEPLPAATAERTSGQPAPRPVADLLVPAALSAQDPEPTQVPGLRSADGSPLAALNALTRPVDTAPATGPAAPPAAAPPPSAPVLQIEGGFRWMLKGGAQEAQLQLHPESLGQVTIHLKVEGGEVHARLWITEPGSVRAIQEGRPHLEASLKEQGLQLGNFDLQHGHRPHQESPAPAAFRERALPDRVPARQEAPAAVPLSILNPRHVELYA